jgi:hypothetical protein
MVPVISGSAAGCGVTVCAGSAGGGAGASGGRGVATTAGERSTVRWSDAGAGTSGSASGCGGSGAGVGAGAATVGGLGPFRCLVGPADFTDAGGLATAAGGAAAGANGHPSVRPRRAGWVAVRREPATGDGPAVVGSRLAVVVVAASGSAGAATAVNSKTASGIVANNSQRRTLGIPCSPCRSRDFRTCRKPDKRVRIPERVRRPIEILRMLQKGNEHAAPPQSAYPARRHSVPTAATEAK